MLHREESAFWHITCSNFLQAAPVGADWFIPHGLLLEDLAAMEISSLVIEHDFDDDIIEQIDTLRTIRLGLAEKMLSQINATADALSASGIASPNMQIDQLELKRELQIKISTLKERLKRRDVIFEDELNFYADLLGENSSISESLNHT